VKPLCIVAPDRSSTLDRTAALKNSVWIAEQTIKRARSDDCEHIALIGDLATCEALSERLPHCVGAVICAHGSMYALSGQDDHLLVDTSSAQMLAGVFVHAVACGTGGELAQAAVDAGALLYVGYAKAVNVEGGDYDRLSQPARDAVAKISTATSLALASGERDPEALRAAVVAVRDDVTRAIQSTPMSGFQSMALQALVSALEDPVIVVGTPPEG